MDAEVSWGDFGIYIPSMGRPDRQRTYENLPKPLQEITQIAVPPQEEGAYQAKWGCALACPVKGIASTRDWILQHGVDRGLKYLVMLDDDLSFLRLQPDGKLKNCTQEETALAFIWLRDQLTEVLHAGFLPRFHRGKSPDNVLSPHRMMHVLGYDLAKLFATEARFSKGVEQLHTMDDFNMTIQLLLAGHINRLSLEWRCNPSASNSKGGASLWRTLENHNQSASRMAELYPGFVRLREKNNWQGMEGDTQYDVTVYWKKALLYGQGKQVNVKRTPQEPLRKKEKVKFYGSPRWSAEIADCSMPLTFDTYSNCSFGCVYCFAAFQRAVGGGKEDYLAGKTSAVDVARVKNIFLEPSSSEFGHYIKDRKTLQWGGMSDPFCYIEKERGVGLELLRFFALIDYPICFSTKGAWWLDDPRYLELFQGRKNWNVKVSIITMDQKRAAQVEYGVPTPKRRLEAIEKIAKLDGGGATLRLRPFMLGITNPTHIELIEEAGKRGATALSTEFFCLERRSPALRDHFPLLKKLSGYDYVELYAKYSNGQGYLRLNRNIKRVFVDEMEAAARRANMRFYVSDAHFKERCDNGSCCGLDETWNYSRGQFCEALVICKKEGVVGWPDMLKHMEHFEGTQYRKLNMGCSNRRAQFYNMNIKDYLLWLWNNPTAGQSPYKMFEGIMKPTSKDADGNLVYEYDASRE